MNGIRWYVVGVLSLLLAVVPRLPAEEPTPGDAGTPECVYLQNTVHDDLRMESEQWRNHGELMKRVQEIVSPELEAGNSPAGRQWMPVFGSNPPSPGLYAVSIPGAFPSTCIDWFQASPCASAS